MVTKRVGSVERTGPTSITHSIDAMELITGCASDPEEVYEEKGPRIPLERRCKAVSKIAKPEKLWYCIDRNVEEIGVLMDIDLASMGTSQEHRSRFRSGTTPFLTLEALDLRNAYTHKFHHELESLLYVLTWHTLGYSLGKYPSEVLDGWRNGSWDTIMRAKRNFMRGDWIDVFRDTDPSDGYLHRRCKALCALYGNAVVSSDLQSIDAIISRLWDDSEPTPSPANTKPAVKY